MIDLYNSNEMHQIQTQAQTCKATEFAHINITASTGRDGELEKPMMIPGCKSSR